MTDPYIHEDHVHEDHIHEERTDTLVERETNPLGAVLAVVVVIFILALVWWMLIAPRSSRPNTTNPGTAPGSPSWEPSAPRTIWSSSSTTTIAI